MGILDRVDDEPPPTLVRRAPAGAVTPTKADGVKILLQDHDQHHRDGRRHLRSDSESDERKDGVLSFWRQSPQVTQVQAPNKPVVRRTST